MSKQIDDLMALVADNFQATEYESYSKLRTALEAALKPGMVVAPAHAAGYQSMVVKQMLNDLCREVSKLIDYDPLSGDFVWKVLPEVSKSVRGKKAGSIRRDGYVYVMFRNKRLLAHRIAWCISTGELPSQLDHINMKRSDNRLCNLRAATNAQNSRNKGRQRNNSTGFKGVTFNKSVKRFQAKICTNGITRSLGYFDSAIEAHNAYANASGVLHEEFARC